MSDILLLLLYVVILAAPFQGAGWLAYFFIRKTSLKWARIASLLVPPVFFFAVFFGLFLWQQSKPPGGLIPMVDGLMLLILLAVTIAGTLLNLVFGAIVHTFLYFRRRRLKLSPPGAAGTTA